MRTRFRPPSSVTINAHTLRYKRLRDSSWAYENLPAYTVPNGTNEYIADEFPHARSQPFTGLEHFCMGGFSRTRLATSHYGQHDGDATMPRTSADLFWVENDYNSRVPTELEQLMHYRYNPEKPWHMQYYSSYEPHSWSASLSARMSNWGIGRGGLAESLGEAPELPKLWHFIQKGRGYYRNVNNAYLAYMFGWRPLLDLIPDVINEIRDYRDGIKPNAARQSGDRILCFRQPIRPPFTVEAERVVLDPRPAWPQMKYSVRSDLTFSKCEAIGMYKCSVSRKPFTGYEIIDRLADLNGIPSFKTVWELMPMSFIVDYFVGIGDLISRMQGNLLYDIDVTNSALGVRIDLAGSSLQVAGGTGVLKDVGNFRYYWRGAMPTPLIGLSLPGTYAIPTGIAMALQRLPRLPRRWTAATKRAFYKALRSKLGQQAISLAGWPPAI